MATTPAYRWVSRHKCAQILSSSSSLCPSSMSQKKLLSFLKEEEVVKGISLILLVQKYGILPSSILSPNEWQTLPLQLFLRCYTISNKGKREEELSWNKNIECRWRELPHVAWSTHQDLSDHASDEYPDTSSPTLFGFYMESEMLIMCFFFFSLLPTELFF